MFVCRRATRLPTVIDTAAMIHSAGPQMSLALANAAYEITSRPVNPAVLETTDRYAVTGVGAPSYVSGTQKWNGTADTLKAKPRIVNMTPRVNSGSCDRERSADFARIASKVTEPSVAPYTSDMPKSSTAADSTPMMKNFSAASLERASPFRHPAMRNVGPVTNSRPTKIVMRSRLEAITTAPSTDASMRK